MKESINFGAFKDIKKATEYNKSYAEQKKSEFREYEWSQYDSSLAEYGNTFIMCIPEKYSGDMRTVVYDIEDYEKPFKKYIYDTFKNEIDLEKQLTAVEFGGPGSNLFDQGLQDIITDSVGVCLEDIRDDKIISEDREHHHFVITGDLLNVYDKKLYEDIEKKLKSKKVNLIISRMMGPLDEIKKHPIILEKVIRKWYGMLDDKGIIFAEFEYFNEHNPDTELVYWSRLEPEGITENEIRAQKWVEGMQKMFPNNEVEFQLGRGVLRIQKNHGAPEELPTISIL